MSTETPPSPEQGWADSKGSVLWADMDKHLTWLASKAREATTVEERAKHELQAATLRGWCKLFEHDIAESAGEPSL